MSAAEIASYLKAEIEPMEDKFYGNRYRVAAYLIDGTYLPCVVFQSKERLVELALRRFSETNMDRSVVEIFVAGRSTIASYDVARVEPSPFAWPKTMLKQIHGETTMGWTAFVAVMNDGRRFSYGTQFHFEFFDVPDGYRFSDVKEIQSGMIYLESDGVKPFSFERQGLAKCLREKPFFSCYLGEIAA